MIRSVLSIKFLGPRVSTSIEPYKKALIYQSIIQVSLTTLPLVLGRTTALIQQQLHLVSWYVTDHTTSVASSLSAGPQVMMGFSFISSCVYWVKIGNCDIVKILL